MNTQQSPMRFLTRSSYGISLGVLLTLCIYFRPDHRGLSTLHHLSYQTAELDAHESRSLSQSNATLLPRDTYQCSASKPCSNGACCGKSGYCGYGPTYCGSGCVSDCNAVAECGQYAKIANTQCPLNTCCSEFGFCGTTTDFCGKGCQSNCILNPTPSGSGSSSSILQNKVIGYYESWSARLNCHKVAPTDLPLDALTHINFAFAYIDPGSLQVVTMDGSTPSSLFSDITNVKSIKEDLSIFVSIGGWSFSDNGTATQPLYGEIAADAGKRQTFADNVVHFMKQYGFDGLDIDWEYPGAPDRGGQEEDTKNYVSLLQVLRQTFDRSGNKFGLSFTTPSSYWYLRWFDLPNMMKYADWTNLMSYDLHGVWDATDPIGSIVQGHTNLTEIKLATELFWRVHIPPEKIVMGFGFYGRSFTLADPSCSKPGCPFSGASNPGPCSATAGILAYYEIMDILNGAKTGKKRGTISPTHDSVDAVNYFTFDNDQWVSYDDATTFKQKVDWANGVGLGGALIWASDLDDGKYTAHAGLLGRSIQSTPSLQNIDKALSAPQAVIQDLAGSNGQNCFIYTGKCVNLNDNDAVSAACGAGNTSVGWDDAGCGKKSCHCGKPICCPTNTAPKNCMWRGDNNGQGTGSDCSAQCAPGEVNIQGIGSSWGGGYLNDGNTNKCGRGRKVFCCPSPDFKQVTQGCSYAGCGKGCPTGTTSIFEKADNCFVSHQKYCCPDPVELTGCHWVGGTRGFDCVNAVCNSTELEIDRAQFGGSQLGGCSYGRQKAACCTVQMAPPPPASCSTNLCNALPGFCNDDDDDESANGYTKRDLALSTTTNSENVNVLEERGGSDTYRVDLGNGVIMHVIAIAYPAIGSLFGGPNAANILREFFRLIPGYCTGTSIQTGNIGKGKKPSGLGGMQTEHPIDRQVMARFVQSSASGSLPSGAGSTLPPIRQDFYTHDWDIPNAQLHARPAVGGPNGIQPLTPNDRAMEAFGSTNYPDPFMAVDAQINGAKGRIMNLRDATAIDTITRLANAAVQQDSQGAADELLQAIRVGIATFDYLRTPEAVARWNQVRQQVRTQLAYIEADVNVPNLTAWWDAFTTDFFGLVEQRAQQWAHNAITAAAAPFTQAHQNGQPLQIYRQVVGALEEMLDEIAGMTLPPNTSGSMPNPQPPGGGGGGGGS